MRCTYNKQHTVLHAIKLTCPLLGAERLPFVLAGSSESNGALLLGEGKPLGLRGTNLERGRRSEERVLLRDGLGGTLGIAKDDARRNRGRCSSKLHNPEEVTIEEKFPLSKLKNCRFNWWSSVRVELAFGFRL